MSHNICTNKTVDPGSASNHLVITPVLSGIGRFFLPRSGAQGHALRSRSWSRSWWPQGQSVLFCGSCRSGASARLRAGQRVQKAWSTPLGRKRHPAALAVAEDDKTCRVPREPARCTNATPPVGVWLGAGTGWRVPFAVAWPRAEQASDSASDNIAYYMANDNPMVTICLSPVPHGARDDSQGRHAPGHPVHHRPLRPLA